MKSALPFALFLALAPAAALAQPAPRPENAPIVTPAAHDAAIALSKTVWSIVNGEPNYADMSPELQAEVKAQLTDLTAMLKVLGLLDTADYQGEGPGGIQGFKCKFAHGKADAVIALDKGGKITTLLFRPTS